MDGGGWSEYHEAQAALEKANHELDGVSEVLSASLDALQELRCYDGDFYDRTCPGLILSIEAHLSEIKSLRA